MSRVAKSPVLLPKNVEAVLSEQCITIKGPMGALTRNYPSLVRVHSLNEPEPRLTFEPSANDPSAWAQAGTLRALVSNMVKGVTVGFQVTLELVGVGYRAQAKGASLTLSLGFSHTIDYVLPEGISAETPNNTTIILKGIDHQKVTQAAAHIRQYRVPEPYKGKGVRYSGEIILLKEAKKK